MEAARGGWKKKGKTGQRWMGEEEKEKVERERENRYLLSFHSEDLKSEASSPSGWWWWGGWRYGEDRLTADGGGR